ncbi:DUF805 domain-containing protein [Brevundimonas sp.]|uniref:DUF805 domain-containing protein n=1 Tax=Brevundimonas sp. TaxID=1871086 RepID=UPI003BAAB0EA
MRGEVISVDGGSGDGLISGEDGVRYSFVAADFSGPAPKVGDRADFVSDNGVATQIVILAGAATASASGPWAGQTSTPQMAGAAVPATAGAGFDFASALFSFNGRLRRSHFWIGFAIIFGASFVSGLIPFLGILLSFALIWPNLAISVKRLHDMGKSGWLVAIPFGIGMVLGVIAVVMIGTAMMADGRTPEDFEADPAAALMLMGPAFGVFALSALVNLAFLLWIGISDSQRGANKFGPNPKGE